MIEGLEAGGWYLLRRSTGAYELRQIGIRHPTTGLPLVAVRTIARSPFPGDEALYLGGYDANSRPAHNTAWVLRESCIP